MMYPFQRLLSAHRKWYESGDIKLDLAYVTPQLIITSMPTTSYWISWYRTPAGDLLRYLNKEHEQHWHIWNLQTYQENDYEDDVFADRVTRFPIADHCPPRFVDLVTIAKDIQAYVQKSGLNTAVIHCKAGQGRSGTVASSFLQLYHGKTFEQANQQFTNARMQTWFGSGVTIPSQQRYLFYLEQWLKRGRPDLVPLYHKSIEIKSVAFHGARYPGIRLTVNIVPPSELNSVPEPALEVAWKVEISTFGDTQIVSFSPEIPLILDSPDICLAIRKTKSIRGFPVPVSYASACFNVYLESLGECSVLEDPVGSQMDDGPPSQFTRSVKSFATSGKITIAWRQLDGMLGTNIKGVGAFDFVEITWATKA